MDALQMAGHLSLEFGAVMEGPFPWAKGERVVRLWLPNRRGLSLLDCRHVGGVQFAAIREAVSTVGVPDCGTPFAFDYLVIPPGGGPSLLGGERQEVTLKDVREAMITLRDLPEIDPRAPRSTWGAAEGKTERSAAGLAESLSREFDVSLEGPFPGWGHATDPEHVVRVWLPNGIGVALQSYPQHSESPRGVGRVALRVIQRTKPRSGFDYYGLTPALPLYSTPIAEHGVEWQWVCPGRARDAVVALQRL